MAARTTPATTSERNQGRRYERNGATPSTERSTHVFRSDSAIAMGHSTAHRVGATSPSRGEARGAADHPVGVMSTAGRSGLIDGARARAKEARLVGLLMRPRRPLMRLAAGAATAGVAYHAGKRHAEQDVYNEQASAPYASTAARTAPAPSVAPAVPAGSTGELERLAKLHDSGALTDAEFGAAKAQLLGV